MSARAAGKVTPEQLYEGGTNSYSNWVEFGAGGLFTGGNKAQAQQISGLPGGAFGGIEDAHYQEVVATNTTASLDGHYLPENHDYLLKLGVAKDGFGYLRISYDNFRTYDAGNGGYSPLDGLALSRGGDALALDRGKISLEAAYNKEGKPQVTFKYTHSYRDGEEGSTLWGLPSVPTASTLRLNPSIESVDDKSDAFQLDVKERIKKTDLGLGVRYESGQINNADLLTSFPVRRSPTSSPPPMTWKASMPPPKPGSSPTSSCPAASCLRTWTIPSPAAGFTGTILTWSIPPTIPPITTVITT